MQEFDGSDSGAKPDEAVSWGKIRLEAKPVKVSVSNMRPSVHCSSADNSRDRTHSLLSMSALFPCDDMSFFWNFADKTV
jgi:hypothetical protein